MVGNIEEFSKKVTSVETKYRCVSRLKGESGTNRPEVRGKEGRGHSGLILLVMV